MSDIIKQLKDKVDELEKLVTELRNKVEFYKYDFLTGLKMRKDLDKELINIFRENIKKTICLVDMNNLHNINKLYGYSKGDELIINVVNKLKEIENEENIFRLGGDEFIIISDKSCEELEKLLNNFSNEFSFSCLKTEDFKTKRDICRLLHKINNERKPDIERL